MLRGIGIYIGKMHVVGAAVVRSGAGYRLESYAIEPIQDAEKSSNTSSSKKSTPESNAIALVTQKINAKRSFARIAVSPFHITTRYFIMPSLPAKEKDEAIRYEASRFTHMKLTESVFGYSESRHVPNVLSITANAAKRRVIQSAVMNLRRGFAEPEAIEPDYVPFSRVYTALGFTEYKKAHAMMWFDSDGGVNVSLSSKGIVFLAQDFRLSGDINKDHEKVRDELSGSIRFLSENAGGAQVEYILLAGFGNLEDWQTYLSESFPTVCTQALRIAVNSESEQIHSGALVLAYGLGLGELGAKSPLGDVTLLPPEDKKLRTKYFVIAFSAAAAAVFIFFFLVFLLIISPVQHSLEQKKIRADAPLSTFGAIALSSMEEIEMQAARVEGKLARLEKFEKSKIQLKEALNAAVQVLPSTIWLEKIHFGVSSRQGLEGDAGSSDVNKPKRLILEGYCFMGNADQEARAVNEWAQKLAKEPGFVGHLSNLAVDEIKQQKISGRSTTRFTVTAEA